MPGKKRQQPTSLTELTSQLSAQLNLAAQNPTIFQYKAHEKQIIFHGNQDKIRLYIGGNRSGKTVGGIVENVWWMTNRHPFRKVPEPPTRGRIVTVSRTEGINDIIIPEIRKWLPPSDLVNGSWEDSYSKQFNKLTLANGSTAEIMTHEQDVEKFAGTSRHWVHFDEEPPKPIYTECKMRTLDTGGSMWITMTPVEGMTWVYEDIYEKGMKGLEKFGIIEVDTTENPYLDAEDIADVLSGLDELELKARKEGKFVQIGGLVFKKFSRNLHVLEPMIPPLGWTQYCSLDHGWNNPTCWLWHAVSPQGVVITFDELYRNETLVGEFAAEIKERNSRKGRREPDIYVGDPSIKQKNAIRGDNVHSEYAKHGIGIVLGNNNVPISVEKINRYFKHNKWGVTTECPVFIDQLQKVRWKVFETAKRRADNNPREEIHKYKDHATDSARYFSSLMPELYIKPSVDDKEKRLNELVKAVMSPATVYVGRDGSRLRVDPQLVNLEEDNPNATEWSSVDEHLGGIW